MSQQPLFLTFAFAVLALASIHCSADNPDLVAPGGGSDLPLVVSDDGGAAAPDGASPDGAAACVPQKVPCGKCGMSDGQCVAGKLVFGACAGEKTCAAGSSYESPDGCGIRTCTKECAWDIWRLKNGNQCFTSSIQSCNAGLNCPSTGKQVCVACKWGTCTCG